MILGVLGFMLIRNPIDLSSPQLEESVVNISLIEEVKDPEEVQLEE